MKSTDIISVVAGAGIAAAVLALVVRNRKPAAEKSPALSSAYDTREVFDANGKRFSNGWRYFSDGTTIDPQGRYYYQGQLTWSPN